MKAKSINKKRKKLLVYKILIGLFAVALLVMPKTVMTMTEIENKLLVTTIGIDKTEKGFEVSGTAVMPQEGQSGSTMRLSVSGEGKSISDALENLNQKMGKKLELGLCGLIVVGDTFGDEKVTPYLEYLLSSGKVIPGSYLLYATEKSAKELIEMANMVSEASSNGLSKLVEYNAHSTNAPAVTLHKFLSAIHGVSNCSYLPCLSVEEKQGLPSSSSASGGHSASSGQSSSGEKETEIKNLKEIIVLRDGKRIFKMDEEQTRGFTWTDPLSTRGLVTLPSFTVNGQSVGDIYCQLLEKDYKLKTGFSGGKPHATIYVDALLSLEDRYKISNLYRYDSVSENELDKELTSQYANEIKKEISSSIDALINNGCDAIGIEESLYRHNYKQYQKYENKGNAIREVTMHYVIKVKFK